MKIAILAWGSLYWDPKGLKTTEEWFYDGPKLPIEFARISSECRLTLVIKPGFDNVTTLYAVSAYENMAEARENLRSRENAPNIDNIGFIDFTQNTQHVRHSNTFIIDALNQWNESKGFDGLLWSDFSPRFTDAIGKQFTLDNIINYLDNLPDKEKQGALKYIRNAPAQITTSFRSSIEDYFGTNKSDLNPT